ncbi:spermatogenesis-associated protein 31D1-like [Pteropus alecto]|uniref:spermatogenesis-associated protein 31D1-like n=1 Tax=Pteropus alecto TaxID=9402 RepID=UPI0003F0F948|nr:spermatogenesis-associated protein 31D1-like [Pteropus alecto]
MRGRYAVGSPTLARHAKVACVCSGPGCSSVPPVSCRPIGQHRDTIRFRQLLCPDPSCDVCNSTTAEVNQLLFPEILEDATPSVSPLASVAPVTESSYSLSPAFSVVPPKDPLPAPLPESFPLPPRILSPEPTTPLADFFSPSPPGHSLPPELFPALKPKIPVDNSPPQSLVIAPLPPRDTQRVDPVVHTEAASSLNTIFSLESTLSQDIKSSSGLSQTMNPTDSFSCPHIQTDLSISPPPDNTFTVTQSKSNSILLKPVPADSCSDNPGTLSAYVPTVAGTDHSNLSMSDLSCWQACAKNMFLPTLSHSDFQQEYVSLHLPDTCLWGDSATKHMETSSDSSPSLNIQAHLERQIQKRVAFQILEKKEMKEGSFSKHMLSENYWTSSWNSVQPFEVEDMTAPKTGWNFEDKPEQLHVSQKLFYVKTLGGNLQQKYSQLFWGLPSLHSESLVATLLVSRSSSPLESRFVLFNGICNAPAVKMQHLGSSPPPNFHLLPLPNVHPQIKPPSQSSTQVHPQAHLHSRLPILSSSPFQTRECGVSSPGSQDESYSHILIENEDREWPVLQKRQEGLWGLDPILQKSQEAICPQDLNPPLVSRPSHDYAPVSILPGNFHITSEPEEKLQLHVPRKTILRRCLNDCRNVDSLALMAPQSKLTKISQQQGKHAHLQLSELQGQSSKDLAKPELSLPGSFYKRFPQKFQLRKDMQRNLGYILEKSPEDIPQRISERYFLKSLRAASDTGRNCVRHSSNHLRNELLNVSRSDLDQNQMKTILRLHLNKKFWQITAGRIPIGVCRSWLAQDNTSPPGSSQTNMENTNSIHTMVGGVYCQIPTLELSFLDPDTREVLEAHIIRFRVNQRWGLPLKVVESIKFYTSRDVKTCPLPQCGFSSSATHISGVDSKAEVSKSLEGSSKTFQGNKVRTTNSVTILDHPLLDSLSVGSEGQGALKPSHADMDYMPVEDVQIFEHGRQSFQTVTHSTIENVSQNETVVDNSCCTEVPTKQAESRPEPRDENVNSSDRAEMIQGQRTVEKNLEHFCMSNMSKEMCKAKEVHAVKSQSCDLLTTGELGSSQRINVDRSKVVSTLTTECHSPKISLPHNSKPSELKKQVLDELKFKLESWEQSQAQGSPIDMSSTSDRLPSQSLLTQSQSISTEDMGPCQVLNVHLEDSRIIRDLRQQPWVSKYVLRKCQDNDFPPAAKKVGPLSSKLEECGSEASGVVTYKARKKSHPVDDGELESTLSSLSQNEQFPPDSYFRKKIRRFFQWINSKRNINVQESPQQQHSAESSAIFVGFGPPEVHGVIKAMEKILEEKLARTYKPEALDLSQQKEELQAQVDPDKGHPSNYGDLSDARQEEWAGTNCCNQEAVSADQSCHTSAIRNRVRHSQKIAAFKDHLLRQSQHPSPPSRDPMPDPHPTCIHETCQVCPATLTHDESTVFRDLTLLFKQKMLLQYFQGEKVPTQKSFGPC